jgi:hypothetical protein
VGEVQLAGLGVAVAVEHEPAVGPGRLLLETTRAGVELAGVEPPPGQDEGAVGLAGEEDGPQLLDVAGEVDAEQAEGALEGMQQLEGARAGELAEDRRAVEPGDAQLHHPGGVGRQVIGQRVAGDRLGVRGRGRRAAAGEEG